MYQEERVKIMLQKTVQQRLEIEKKGGYKQCCDITKRGRRCLAHIFKHAQKLPQSVKSIPSTGFCKAHLNADLKNVFLADMSDEELMLWLTMP